MANQSDLELTAENKIKIQKNKRRIFELDAEISTTHAELMLLLADVDENRALLNRNFTSSFMGNRAISISNVNHLYNSRLAMIETLEVKTEVELNFKAMFTNKVMVDQLENRSRLNEKLSEIIGRVQEVNVMLQSINTLVANANETLVEYADEMISENADWIDGALIKKLSSATANANKQGVNENVELIKKLIDQSSIAENETSDILKRINSITKNILDSGDDIARRRETIQADHERVVANQKRTADLIIKS
jgi:hypothetical protein